MTQQAPRPAVLAISSQVARGSVGLRAAGFAIERLGLPVWKVPTVWMPWHPGHTRTFGAPPRSPTPDEVFARSLEALTGTPVIGEVGAILTGYFASAAQVLAACRAIDAVRERSPGVLVVCDPVSADSHGSYMAGEVIAAISAELLPRCDVATPNRFELAAFARLRGAGDDLPADNDVLADMARRLGARRVAVTSAFAMMRQSIGVLLVDGPSSVLVEHGEVLGAPHGTGDVFAALLSVHLLAGLSLEAAAARASASVFEIVAHSVKAGSDELLLAQYQESLVAPMASVTTRRLAGARLAANMPTGRAQV